MRLTDQQIQLNRTIRVVKELSEGKVLHLPDGSGTIAMGEDMSIGFCYQVHNRYCISPLATVDLKQLNELLNKHDIHII